MTQQHLTDRNRLTPLTSQFRQLYDLSLEANNTDNQFIKRRSRRDRDELLGEVLLNKVYLSIVAPTSDAIAPHSIKEYPDINILTELTANIVNVGYLNGELDIEFLANTIFAGVPSKFHASVPILHEQLKQLYLVHVTHRKNECDGTQKDISRQLDSIWPLLKELRTTRSSTITALVGINQAATINNGPWDVVDTMLNDIKNQRLRSNSGISY